jgi:hypothetical protein
MQADCTQQQQQQQQQQQLAAHHVSRSLAMPVPSHASTNCQHDYVETAAQLMPG